MLHDLSPSRIDIDLAALRHNYTALKRHVGKAKVMAVVKSNAYGHGLVQCATYLESIKVDFLGVARIEEGIALRNAGIKTPILVFGGMTYVQLDLFLEHGLDITVSSLEKLKETEKAAAQKNLRARIHIKIDTGLCRIGVRPESAHQLFEAAFNSPHLLIVGVYTHFATADDVDQSVMLEQQREFDRALEYFPQNNLPYPLRHIANTASILLNPSSHYEMVRTGVGLYGLYPSAACVEKIQLKPVLSFKSRVVYFKVIGAGKGVGYGHTWKAPTLTRIATVPLGYSDGLPRNLGNGGRVLIRGKYFPIVGNLGMDQFMVNLGPTGEAYNGDEVVIIGPQDAQHISAEELAVQADTVPHQIVACLNPHTPRFYHGDERRP